MSDRSIAIIFVNSGGALKQVWRGGAMLNWLRKAGRAFRPRLGGYGEIALPPDHRSGLQFHAMLGKRDGLDHGFGFVDGFFEFSFGYGIVDPAAAGLDVGLAVF
jgi:hypothetical protein